MKRDCMEGLLHNSEHGVCVGTKVPVNDEGCV